jgi:hypothetical protein
VAQLRALPKATNRPGTEIAQRFLSSAFESVNAVFETMEILRVLRAVRSGSGEVKALQGRLTGQEEDLLRAGLVFTGAGLDATLKQLIRDTLPALLDCNEQAHRKFEDFAEGRLGTGEIADTTMIARYLIAANPRTAMIEDYIYDLTGSSLQSAEEVGRVAGALGVDDGSLRKRINGLRSLFVARNEVSHELDLRRPEQPGDRTRRSRPLAATKKLCQEGLDVGQHLVNAVGELLPTETPGVL